MMGEPHPILINADTLEETIPNAVPEFPYYGGLCDLYDYPNAQFPWHWHGEVEFFYMRKGALEYHIPGKTEVFHEGEGGFINANVPHLTMAHGSGGCIQEEHLFLPAFVAGSMGSAIETRYVLPIIHSQQMDMVRFGPKDVGYSAIISLMREALSLYEAPATGYELEIRNCISRLWLLLYNITRNRHSDGNTDTHDSRIRTMLSYIAVHYAEPITLSQIAEAVYISPRECLRTFRRALNTTPVEYLTTVRIARARELLWHTRQSVSEIGAACGFNSGSYFGKVFRRYTGCTPLAFRAKASKAPDADQAHPFTNVLP